MTADQIIDWLAGSPASQREKLATVRERYLAIVRELDDDDHQRVVRALKKRLGSPKLASELAALLVELVRDRVPRPRPGAVPVVEDLPIYEGDRRAQLEAAIAANPDAQAPYLPYADWLESEGNAFGPLIAIDRELAKNPGHKAMKEERRSYLGRHRAALLGPLVDPDDTVMAMHQIDKSSFRGLSEVGWHMGFIRTCRVTTPFLDRGRPYGPIANVLRALLDEPGPGRFVQHLRIGSDFEPTADSPARVLGARPRPALRSLQLDWRRVDGVVAMWPALANLRELEMSLELADAEVLAAVAPALPRLERLVLASGDLDAARMRALATATWPSLVQLDIDNSFDVGVMFDSTALPGLLDGVHAPRLQRLAVRGVPDSDALCEALARSSAFEQLVHLDLSRGTVGERGVRALMTRSLAGLDLVLDANYVPAALHAPLAAVTRSVTLEWQRDDNGDPTQRFVGAHE